MISLGIQKKIKYNDKPRNINKIKPRKTNTHKPRITKKQTQKKKKQYK